MTAAFYIAILAICYLVLSVYVVKGRQHYRVLIGDGQNENMLRRMRAQANFAEYTPIFLILLLTAEQYGLTIYLVHLFGVLYTLGRLSHAYGLLKAERIADGKVEKIYFRQYGMYATLSSILLLACYLLFKYLS